jgi:hypothetical protein
MPPPPTLESNSSSAAGPTRPSESIRPRSKISSRSLCVMRFAHAGALSEGHRRDRPRQLQRRHERAGIPVVRGLQAHPDLFGLPDARRERMYVRVSAATARVNLGSRSA